MGKSVSRLYRSTRAVVLPKQPATRNSAKAQQQLIQEVNDDEVMEHDATLRRNLRSVYLQSETTPRDMKPQQQQGVSQVDRSSSGMTADELLLMFYERRNNELAWTAERVATDYKLSLNDAKNLLRYFNNFVIVQKLPPPKSSPLVDKVYSID